MAYISELEGEYYQIIYYEEDSCVEYLLTKGNQLMMICQIFSQIQF